jgi:hypothetical protein
MGERLRILYKFMSMSVPHARPALTAALRENVLWWSSPASFNDPFDCKPYVTFEASKLKRDGMASRVVRLRLSKGDPRTKGQLVRLANKKSAVQVAREMQEAFDGFTAESSICCFTTRNDSVLMWGHYADSHKGIALVFSELPPPDDFLGLPVEYSNQRPVINLTKIRPDEDYIAALLRKSEDWSYEHEIRMLGYREPAGYRPFPRAALIGILLGANIADEDREFVKAVRDVSRPSLRLKQARLAATEYKMTFEDA